MAKTQFPGWKIEMLIVWLSFLLLFLSQKSAVAEKNDASLPIFSALSEPNLIGPDNLCFVFGNVLGTFSGGGDPGDVYDWTVTKSSGEVIFSRSGGAQLETIQVVFSEIGNYVVSLKVRRGTNADYYTQSKTITVQKGPELALLPDYLLCAGSPTLITALNPNTPNLSEFTIEWRDIDGNLLGTGNEYLSYSAGYHLVEIYRTDSNGNPSCVIKGSTFVGPPIDFELVPSATSVCEGNPVRIGLDTPLSGDWFIQKDFTGPRSPLGSGFEITIKTEELQGPGLYLVTFQTTTADFPDCLTEKIIGFEVLEAPKGTYQIIAQPDDCSLPNGSFDFRASTDLDAFYIPELNYVSGPVAAGQQVNFSGLKPMVYSLVMEKNGCQITNLLILDSKNPPASPNTPSQLSPVINFLDETCSTSGITQGGVTVDFQSSVTNGKYRVLTVGIGEVSSGTIPSNGQLEINLSTGDYLLELQVDGCTYPIESFSIQRAPQVEFTVPQELNICEIYSLIPDTKQNLRFTLQFPDGSTQTISSGQEFTLTEAGAYSILGEGVGPEAGLCPKRTDFTATFSTSISFEPILAIEKCFDPIRYIFELEGIPVEEASIRWLNEQGEIVGRGQEFYPAAEGKHSLLIQPLKSGFCPVTPVEFIVEAPINEVVMELEAEKICPPPALATVKLITNEVAVVSTEWIFYDLQDQRQELDAFDNLFEIEIDQPGTYEAVGYNKFGCEIGRTLLAVELSTLLTEPDLEEEYGVCVRGKSGPTLNPGNYASYSWFFEDQFVSNDPEYMPTQVGNYSLSVLTEDGCEFTDTFQTYDACSFEYVMPNAMVLGDLSRNFQVFLSRGVTEAELFIYNRQGELIHHDQSQEIPVDTPIFSWDGIAFGKQIPVGTYVVVLSVSNPQYSYEEKINASLLVIQ